MQIHAVALSTTLFHEHTHIFELVAKSSHHIFSHARASAPTPLWIKVSHTLQSFLSTFNLTLTSLSYPHYFLSLLPTHASTCDRTPNHTHTLTHTLAHPLAHTLAHAIAHNGALQWTKMIPFSIVQLWPKMIFQLCFFLSHSLFLYLPRRQGATEP